MAEAIFGFLYQAAVFLLNGLSKLAMGLAGAFFQEKVETVLEDAFDPKKKLEKQIARLRAEEWFRDLEADFRYGYIIWNNSMVGEYLADDKNISLLLKLPEERADFTRLVLQEHRKFVVR